MLTPEVQQYISQSRSQGVPDAQIRQTLVAQGWQQADLDQAFGVASSGKMPVWGKVLIAVVIFFFLLPGLIWLGIIGFGIYAVKHSGVSYTQTGTAGNTSNSKKPLNCDDPQLSSVASGNLSPILPTGWPSDLPVYPGSKLLGSNSLGLGSAATFASAYYCSKDDVNKISDYFLSFTSGWTFSSAFNGSQSNSTVDGQSISVVGKKGNSPDGVIIGVSTTGNGADTLIYETYEGSTQK